MIKHPEWVSEEIFSFLIFAENPKNGLSLESFY